MKIKDIIAESHIEEQRLDEFLPLALAALGGTAAGATLGDYLLAKKKGEKDWSFGQSVGRNLERGERFLSQKVAPAAEKFGKEVYKGYTGKDAPETLDQWLSSDDEVDLSSPDRADTDRVRRRQEFEEPFPGKQNEDLNLKKKREVNEANKKTDFELEVEKHFQDPYTRRAIMAKARQESGGRNIGEMDWTRTSNNSLKKAFPQLQNLDDSKLNALKAQGNEAFLNYAYKNIGGYKYRGRGPIQITGKGNYETIDKQLGLNGALVKDPDMLLRDPKLANAASVQYLKNAGLHKKTFDNQRQAHQEVIYAIGGSLYAPGSKRSNRVLSQIEKDMPGGDKSNRVAQADTDTSTRNNKTSVPAVPAVASTDKDQSGDVAASKDKPAEPKKKQSILDVPIPVDTGKPGDIIAQANKELAAKRAAIKREPTGIIEPTSVVPKAPKEPIKAEPEIKKIDKEITSPAPSTMASAASFEKSGWLLNPSTETPYDEFMNKLTKSQHGQRTYESVNTETELTDILRLAGRKK